MFSLFYPLNSLAQSDSSLELPDPILSFAGTQERDGLTVFNFDVLNYSAYPDEMFDVVTDSSEAENSLPASRTTVEIYDADTNYMHRFIELHSATDLNGIWVAHEINKISFKSVYIKLVDHLTNKSYQSNTIIVTPDAVFNKAVSYPAGEYPTAILSGDLNGDNKIDLVIDGYGSRNILFLAGNGDGTFKSAVQLYSTLGYNPDSIALGDLNNDLALDLIFSTHKNIYILLGKGDGTFTEPNTIPQKGT